MKEFEEEEEFKEEEEEDEKIGYYTYTPGFAFTAELPITTSTIVALCDQLASRFGAGYVFGPEQITEGGVLMVDWPGRNLGELKTFRFWISEYTSGPSKWPFIADPIETREEWRQQIANPRVIWDIPTCFLQSESTVLHGHLFYKAFFGAPCWNTTELRYLAESFAAVGILPTAGTVMDRKTVCSLVARGNLGIPTPELVKVDALKMRAQALRTTVTGLYGKLNRSLLDTAP